MSDAMAVETIETRALPERAAAFKAAGYRLVQVCATRLPDGFEITYSFARESECPHLRVTVPASDPRVPSISGAYWGAFSYENEIHDLFGIRVEGMNIFYNGAFYKTAVPKPFSTAGVCGVPPQNPRPSAAPPEASRG